MEGNDWNGVRIYTLGHSTRSFEELLSLLRGFGVSVLADIRTIPRSRRNPQFDTSRLAESLPPEGVQYVHLPRLGGLRRPRKDSINEGWQNASFRGFADYMSTVSFEQGLADLYALTFRGRVTLMCAEAVPWRCHRSLVADVLTVRGAEVEHITGPVRSFRHRLTSFAQVHGSRVTYPVDKHAEGESRRVAGTPPRNPKAPW